MNHRSDLLKARRKQLGYTVRDVSKKTGLANGTITGAERRDSDPKASTIKKLAKCYILDPSLVMTFNKRLNEFHLAEVNGAG